MPGIWTMGEILVEFMRPQVGIGLGEAGEFKGPFPSGAPAIFVDAVARMGHQAGIIGGVGQDDFGRCVLERLERDGVDCRYVKQLSEGATADAFVTYFADGSRKFIYHIDHTPAVWVSFDGSEDLGRPDFFHVMGCSLMANDTFRAQIIRAMQSAADRGAKVSFDPNIRVELLRDRDLQAVVSPVLERCAVLLPGTAELTVLGKDDDPFAAARNLFEKFPLEVIVLKRGGQGCIVLTPTSQIEVAAYPVIEVDPTGAGDCFDAGFLCGMVEGRSLQDCAKIAAAAGALDAAAYGAMEGSITRQNIAKMTGLSL